MNSSLGRQNQKRVVELALNTENFTSSCEINQSLEKVFIVMLVYDKRQIYCVLFMTLHKIPAIISITMINKHSSLHENNLTQRYKLTSSAKFIFDEHLNIFKLHEQRTNCSLLAQRVVSISKTCNRNASLQKYNLSKAMKKCWRSISKNAKNIRIIFFAA